MKRSLIALAALAVVGAASAQSSVTIFGIVDAAVSVGNGDTANKTQLTNSSYNSSRLGFRGVEDLGGGLKAAFHIEGALSNDDGNATGLTFQRKSVVSLIGSMGEIRLGRDYTPNFWSYTVYDPFGTNGVGTTRALGGSTVAGSGAGATAVRASNSVAYLSPTVSGFAVWGQVYFGEQLSNAVAQTGDGGAFRVTYDQGPLSLAVAYSKTTTGAGTDVQTTNFGGSYNMGVAQLMAFWNKDANTGLSDRTGYTIGALVPVAPAGTVRVSFSNTDYNGAKTDQFSLGYVYDFSKRTAVYGTFSSLSNSGYTAGGVAAGATAANTPGLNGALANLNGSSTGFDIGIRHAF